MSESVPTMADKTDLVRHVLDAWNEFRAFTDALPDVEWTTNTDPAGWTVKDHVVHVTAWDEADIAVTFQGVTKQQALSLSDDAWMSLDWDMMNAEIRDHHLGDSVAQVRANQQPVFEQILSIIEGFSDQELASFMEVPGLSRGEHPLRDDLYHNFPYHYREHLGYIQQIVVD